MEAIQIGNSVNISSLPDELLVYIFSFLKRVGVRACRIVCKRWNSCCEERIITRTEKFVFHSPMYQSSEINEFLVCIKRSRINVDFINVDLAALDFKKFGEKIDELQITNCFHQDESILKNLFITTPNMTCLRFKLNYSFYDGFSESEVISKKVIGLLREENFQNANLKEFQCHYEDRGFRRLPIQDHPFPISHLLSIFPYIESVSTGYEILLKDAELRNVLLKSNITCILGFCELFLKQSDLSKSFAYLSKLKILQLRFPFPPFVRGCDRIFSQATELKKLELIISCYKADEQQESPKILLFHILRSCLKLTELSIQLCSIYDVKICLNNRDEVKLFYTSILKMQKVCLPKILVKPNLEKPDPTVLNGNNFLEELHMRFDRGLCESSDLFYMLLRTCRQLKTLELRVEEVFCSNYYANVTEILQTQKYLQSLEIHITCTSDTECSQADLNQFILSKHESLKSLNIRFRLNKVGQTHLFFLKWLSTWEFPNLQTLKVDSDGDHSVVYSQSVCCELRKHYKECLTRMSTLTQISLQLSFLKFEDCEKICCQILSLENIHWMVEDPGEPQKIVNLFVNLPNLRHVVLHYYFDRKHRPNRPIIEKSLTYFYCGSKKQLFEKCDLMLCHYIPESRPYKLVDLLE